MALKSSLPSAFQEYVEISKQLKTLEERRKEIQYRMFDYLDEQNSNELPFGNGVFYRKSRTTYEYSDNVRQIEQRVKEIKKQEEASGVATVKSVSQYMTFTESKEE